MATQEPQPSSSDMAQESSTNYVNTTVFLSYKVPFPVRLRFAIFTVARFLRIMPDTQPLFAPEFTLIGKGQRSVEIYRESLLYLYAKPKMQHLRFDHWKMTELRTYKDKKTKVRHEYIIATFNDGGEGKVHLRMERRIQNSSVKSRWKSAPPSDSEQGGARPKDPTSAIKKLAHDDVSIYPDHQLVHDEKNGDKTRLPVDHIVFPEDHRMNLPQLVLLACAINECSTTYHLTQNNCYWFCYTMAEALKARFPDFNSLLVRGKNQQGTWLRLPANMLFRGVNITELLARTDAMFRVFRQEIDELINNPNNKHTREARELAEKEKKRAEEEKKRAEEEKKRAEEEKKRAEEAEGRAEEEKRRAEEEKRRAEEAERRIAELEAKLAAQAKAT